jgi:DNA-binding Lrp family transcriptional regulator
MSTRSSNAIWTSGRYDYLLKFVTRSVSHYQGIIDGLLERDVGIGKYLSYVIIKTAFAKTHYPLEALFSPNLR